MKRFVLLATLILGSMLAQKTPAIAQATTPSLTVTAQPPTPMGQAITFTDTWNVPPTAIWVGATLNLTLNTTDGRSASTTQSFNLPQPFGTGLHTVSTSIFIRNGASNGTSTATITNTGIVGAGPAVGALFTFIPFTVTSNVATF